MSSSAPAPRGRADNVAQVPGAARALGRHGRGGRRTQPSRSPASSEPGEPAPSGRSRGIGGRARAPATAREATSSPLHARGMSMSHRMTRRAAGRAPAFHGLRGRSGSWPTRPGSHLPSRPAIAARHRLVVVDDEHAGLGLFGSGSVRSTAVNQECYGWQPDGIRHHGDCTFRSRPVIQETTSMFPTTIAGGLPEAGLAGRDPKALGRNGAPKARRCNEGQGRRHAAVDQGAGGRGAWAS